MFNRIICLALFLLPGLVFAQMPDAETQRQQDLLKKPPYERMLTGKDAEKAEQLEQRIGQQEDSDSYAEAIQSARDLLSLRVSLQGADHHEAIDAKFRVSRLEVISARPAEKRREWQLSVNNALDAEALQAQGQFADADAALRRYTDLCSELLGEDHPSTATSCNDLAFNLSAQGYDAEAAPLFQKALDIRRKVLGERHPDTATGYNNVAYNLDRRGKMAEAASLHKKALDIRREVLGEEHPDTANSYNNLAFNLQARSKYAEAVSLNQKALNIHRKMLGEEHPDTARSYNNLAVNLHFLGKDAEAGLLYQKALDINRKVLGEEHPDTANNYSNLASNLDWLGKATEAALLHQKALDIRRKVLGEQHPDTAKSYNGLAANLGSRGQDTEATPLYEKVLEIRRNFLGEQHPDTAETYNNLGRNLEAQGKAAYAAPLYLKALEIYRNVLGEDHPDTASVYHNLAANLYVQGQTTEAAQLYRKALDIYRKILGEDHLETATCYNGLAANLEAEGKHAEAAQLFRKALDINRKILGEQHPNTAKAYSNLAMNLCVQGKSSGASQTLLQAVQAYEASRLNAAAGIERAQLSDVNPRLLLAALQQATEPAAAWENVELSLARGLLDQQRDNRRDLTPLEQSEWTKETERVAALNPQILYLATRPKRSTDEKAELDQLIADRRQAEERLAALDVLASTRGVARPEAIRAALAADAAVLCWIDVAHSTDKIQEHWACVVRRDGEPHWVRLPGTGPEASWTSDDSTLPSKLRAELRQERPSPTVSGLAAMLRAQRIEPVLKHLEGVKTLYVIGVNEMAGIPVDLLAPEFTTSYVPSGTFLARRGQPRQKPVTLLVMGDPVFPPVEKQVVSTASPPGGLLITQVVPEGAAAKAGVRVNDVLVAYAGQEIDDVDHLGKLIADNAERKDLTLKIWRETEDKLFERDVVPGRLGVALAAEPAVQAIKARRDAEMMLANLNRGGSWDELPGTQVEVAQLERLFPKDHVTRLTRSEANEQTLESLRKMGELAKFRFLHFATHGEANNVRAFDSALILSQDSLPEEPKVQNGEAYLNGQLTASEVLELWNGKLDADLVTLSACETAIGKSGGGDGMLGFAQAFLLAGSRSVCLSLWKVDDTATTLVMDRFYRNLLGKREDGAQPIGKAAALHEAKTWLRNLTLAEATDRLGVLTDGVSRGSKKGREVIGEVPIAKDSAGDSKPYSHPKYWAAFILIGDPD